MGGVDEIVRRLPGSHLTHLVFQPYLPHQAERLGERQMRRRVERARILGRSQAVEGAAFGTALAHRVVPGDVRDDRDAAVLDVEPAGVLAFRLDDKVLPKPGGRPVEDRALGEPSQEQRVSAPAPRR